MSDELNPNKLHPRDRRRMENIRDRLRSQNYGEDEATRLALEQLQRERHAGRGGGRHAGGEPQKPTPHGGATRTGTDSGGGK